MSMTGALLSGLILGFSFIKPAWGILCLISLVPLLITDRHTKPGLWFLMGFVVQLVGFHWLPAALQSATGFSSPLVYLLCLALHLTDASRWIVSAWITRTLRQPKLLPWIAVLMETLWPRVFPWTLGSPLDPSSFLGQWSEWGGPVAVSLGAWLINGTVSDLCRSLVRRRWPSVALMLWSCFLLLAGWIRTTTLQKDLPPATIKVGLIQTNMSADFRQGNPAGTLQRQLDLTAQLPAETDLVVWPETAVTYRVPLEMLERFVAGSIISHIRKPLVLGIDLDDPTQAEGRLTNSAVAVSDRGYVTGRYDKRRLMPIYERSLPLQPASNFRAGGQAEPLLVSTSQGPLKANVFICYESLFSSLVRTVESRLASDLLINISNDDFFAKGPGALIHEHMSRWRAVELRRYLIRVSNSGFTEIIDPLGQVTTRLPIDQEGAAVGLISPRADRTLYARWGQGPWLLLCCLVLIYAADAEAKQKLLARFMLAGQARRRAKLHTSLDQ